MPTRTGGIAKISLWLYLAVAGDIHATIELRDGLPGAGGNLLGTASATIKSATPAWHDFVFDPVPRVTAMNSYHYRLTFTGGNGALKQGYKITSSGNSPYAGGDHYQWNHQDFPNQWKPWDDADLAFRVYLALNQAPTVATNAGLSVNEGATATIAQTNLNATDPDGDTVTYTIGTAPTKGALKKGAANLGAGSTFTQADINAGQVTYTHNGDEPSPESFTFTAEDGKGGTIDSTTFNITVAPVNDPPTFTLGSNVTVLEDSLAYSAANFLTGASPGEAGQTMTTTVSNNNNTLFLAPPLIDGTGKLTFTPASNANGTAQVTVTVTDNGGIANGGDDSTEKSFSITVTPVNDPPSFTLGGTHTAAEDSGAQAAANWASAINPGQGETGQVVSFTVLNDKNSLFSVQPAIDGTGKLTYTPAPDAVGSATVTVTAKDDGGTANSGADTSAPQAFTITITPVNDNPVGASDTAAAIAEDSGEAAIPVATLLANDKPGPVTAIDEISQTLSITAATVDPTHGSVSVSGGNVRFTPAADFYGTATITYTLEDSLGATAPVTLNVPVTPVPDAPFADNVSILEDTQSAVMQIRPSDLDGPEVTFFRITAISGGTLYLSDDRPTLGVNDYITVAEGLSGVRFTPNTDLNDGNAAPDWAFYYDVAGATTNTGTGLGEPTRVLLSVQAVNDLPVLADDTLATVAEDSGPWPIPYNTLLSNDKPGPATATDETAQTLTVSAVGGATGGTLTTTGAGVDFTPTAHKNGPFSFTYTVQDSGAAPNTATATVRFTVTEVNDAPEASDDPLSAVDEDSAPRLIPVADLLANDQPGPAAATDEAGQTLTIASLSNVTGGTADFNVARTHIIFTLTPNYEGPAGFTYTVEDNGTTNGASAKETDTAVVSFTVNGIAESPAVTPVNTEEDTISPLMKFIPNAADAGKVTHYKVQGISGGTLYKLNGTDLIPLANPSVITAAEGEESGLKFRPDDDANGTSGFGFEVAAALDVAGTGTSPFTQVNISVAEANDPPTGNPDDAGEVAEDTTAEILISDLLANDSKGPANESGQTLSIDVAQIDNVVGGSVTQGGPGKILFTPDTNYTGPASFRYTVTDDGTTGGELARESSTATVSLTITPVPDAPRVTAAGTDEDEETTVVIQPHTADVSGVTHFVISGITGGSLYNGTTLLEVGNTVTTAEGLTGLRYVPEAHKNTQANGANYFTVSVKARDAGRDLTSAASTTVTIAVAEVNDQPTANPDTLSAVAEDTPAFTFATSILTANDSPGPDESSQTLTVDAVAAVTGGAVSLDKDTQTITFTPEADFFGTAEFTYTVTDNGIPAPLARTGTVYIPISARVDVPTITPASSETAEETQSGLIKITRHAKDDAEVTKYLIPGISGGKLYKADGTTEVKMNTFITYEEGTAGLRFTPDQDLNSPAANTFTFSVQAASDVGAGTSGPVTASITVYEVNDAPKGVNDPLTGVLIEDTGPWYLPFSLLTANDDPGASNESGQAFTVDSVGGPFVGGSVEIDTVDPTRVKFTPDANFNGTASFTYYVQDFGTTNAVLSPKTAATPATVTFAVSAVNDDPVGTPDTLAAVDEDSPAWLIPVAGLLANDLPGPAGATDEAGQTLKISAVSDSIGGSAVLNEAKTHILFTLAANHDQPAGFTYTVEDDGTPAASSTVTVTFNVNAMAEVPTADAPKIAESTLSGPVFKIHADPADGAAVTYFKITDIAGGWLYDSNDLPITGPAFISRSRGEAGLKFKPFDDLNTPANDPFAFTVQAALDDTGTGLSPAKVVTIEVFEVNNAPTAVDDAITRTFKEDTGAPWIFDAAELLANDDQGAPNESSQNLTISIPLDAIVTGGSVEMADGNVRFTPTANAYGAASFQYIVTDNGTTDGQPAAKSSGKATVSFTIDPQADAPQITPTTTDEDKQSTSGLVITRNTVDGPEVTHFEITAIKGGTLYRKDGTTLIPLTDGTYLLADQADDGLFFSPEADANTQAGGTFGFTAKASLYGSNTDLSSGTPASITVNQVNDEPTAVTELLDLGVAEDATATPFPASALTANDTKGADNESGQTLTITSVTAGEGGLFTLNEQTQIITFTPAANFFGTATFSYTVTDDGTNNNVPTPKSSTVTSRIAVSAVADAPDVTATETAEETQSNDGGLVITRSDVDKDEVTHFKITGINTANGTLYKNDGTTVIGEGTYLTAAEADDGLKFTPNPHLNTPAGDVFTFTVWGALSDTGAGLSPTGTQASITVTEVNDRPTGTPDSLSAVTEDSGPWTIPFSALTTNDDPGTNEEGQGLTVDSVSTDALEVVGGTVAKSGTDVIFTPDLNFNGTASFKYIVGDLGTTNDAPDHLNALASVKVSIPVTEVNDDPIAVADTLDAVAEDSAPLYISIASLLSNDSPGPANESTQTVTFTGLLTNPIGGSVEVDESDPARLIFRLTANYHGPAGFTYEVTDNGTTGGAPAARKDTATVSFIVTPVGDAPSISPAVTREETLSPVGHLKITRNPADGPEVTHYKITAIEGGTLYHADGTTGISTVITAAAGEAGLRFLPAENLNDPSGTAGTFGFTVQAATSDAPTGLSTGTAAVIKVHEVNDPPKGHDDTLTETTVEDSGDLTIAAASLLANDEKGAENESGQTLTVIDADDEFGGEANVVDGDVVFTPGANFFGTAHFRYTLKDNGTTEGVADGLTSTAYVYVEITPVPDAPRVDENPVTEEDTPVILIVQPHVNDGAEVTDFVIGTITGGTLRKSDGTVLEPTNLVTRDEGLAGLKFTPAAHANSLNGGTFRIEVKAHDRVRNLTSPAATATITVTEVNDAPTGVDDTLADVAEDAAEFAIEFADLTGNDVVGINETGQTLTVSAVSAPTGGTVEIRGGKVYFKPEADFNGPAKFTYTLTDDGTTNGTLARESATAVARFTITEVNDDPIGADDTLADVAEDTGPWRIPLANLLVNDKTGPANESAQTLTVSAVSSPTDGEVDIDGTDVLFTPTLNFNGTASFTYTLRDNGKTAGNDDALTDTAVASFTVTPVNDAPVAADKTISLIVGERVSDSVEATDIDQDPLTYALVTLPTHGTVTMNADGSFIYSASRVGTDTFTYKANDSMADSNTARVTVTISPVPIVPTVSISAPVTLTRESSILVSGTANPGYYVAVGGTTVQADSGGNWSATVALVEGPNVITATNGPASASVTVVRDTTPPALSLTAPAERTDAESIVLTATSQNGAIVTIEGVRGTSLTVPLQMGMNRFTATATDLAGNQATATVSVIRVGKVPPPVVVKPDQGEPTEVTVLRFKVQIPGEAVVQPVLLEIASPSQDTAAVRKAEGAAIVAVTGDAGATAQEDGENIHGLEAPATVTFTYDPAVVSDPMALRIYYFDPKLKVWVELGGVVDLASHTITVKVEHFTTFAAMEPRADAPVLDELPALVRDENLTATGTFLPESPVSLVINGEVQATLLTDSEGRFSLQGKLHAGRNWVYVKGTGTLASRELTVHYRPVGYTDIGGHWAEEQIERLARLEVVSLYPEPLFQPEAKVTRLEFAVMVARVLGLTPATEAPSFTDTDLMPAWSLPEMTAAVKAGIIKGMPDGSFAPEQLVTRAEMAVMLSRALTYAGLDDMPGEKAFTDGEQIPAWAKAQVLTAARYGLITGYPDGSFQSGNSTTRAEAVTMLARLMDLVSGN